MPLRNQIAKMDPNRGKKEGGRMKTRGTDEGQRKRESEKFQPQNGGMDTVYLVPLSRDSEVLQFEREQSISSTQPAGRCVHNE